MNVPNKLTVFRIILTPIFLLTATLEILPHRFLIATIIFCVASVTDFIDGNLARKNDQITVLGKLLDPLADKILVTTALLLFLKYGFCDVWVVAIILAREFLITSIRLVATTQGIVIPANMFAKIKTTVQMISTIAIMVMAELKFGFKILPESFNIFPVADVLLWIAAVFTILSGIVYIVDSRKVIDFTK